MEKIVTMLERSTCIFTNISFATLAFILLFFTETSYYLLILQTGIVDYFHSDITQIWVIPLGGVLGILAIATIQKRSMVVSLALAFQTLLMFFYPHFNSYMLFILGFLSGLVAPYLIFQLRSLNEIVVILALAYLLGTFAISIAPEQRGELAIVLSLVALFASYFVVPISKKGQEVVLKPYLSIFLWLVLDATLFETLARSSEPIWANEHFTLLIALSHLVGLLVGYLFVEYKENNRLILMLFALSYLLFWFNQLYLLAIVYPIVISYYNVIILKRFMTLSFEHLTLVSLSLWVSSGMGLFLALIFHHLI